MIGVFDSGLGGLTVLRALLERFKTAEFVYLADHAHVPYGNRSSEEIVDYTRGCVEDLFTRGAKLVLLGCNTATAVALLAPITYALGSSLHLNAPVFAALICNGDSFSYILPTQITAGVIA